MQGMLQEVVQMKQYRIIYTPDREHFYMTEVQAPNTALAIVEFSRNYPECEYADLEELAK